MIFFISGRKVKEFNTQDNYVKRIQYFAKKNILSSISENNSLTLYEIVEDESSKQKYLTQFWKRDYNLTILYDIVLENLNEEKCKFIFYYFIL